MEKFGITNPTYFTRDAVNGIIQPRTSTDKEYLFNNKQIYSNSDDALIKNLSFYKSRGTYASPTVITTGDYLGEIVGYGYDGNEYRRSGSIRFKSAGTIAGTRVPSQIEFWTSTDTTPSIESLAMSLDTTQRLVLFGGAIVIDKTYDLRRNSLGVVSTDGVMLRNDATATSIVPVQMSPRVRFRGQVWNTTGAGSSETSDWIIENLPTSGTTPSSLLKFGYSRNGGTYSYPVTISNNGDLSARSFKLATGWNLTNVSSSNIFSLNVGTVSSSGYISRNTDDAYSAFAINNANASSTGNILDLQWQGVNRISFTKNGSINLNTTDALGAGIININGNRYFHAYSPVVADSNLFAGYLAGNFTMAGTGSQASYNVGIGRASLLSITTGSYNTGIGMRTLGNNLIGDNNTAIGYQSLYYNISSNLTSIGAYAFENNTTGTGLVAVGYQAGKFNVKGINNSYFGYQAGYSGTTVVSSIAITNGGTGYTAGDLIVDNTGTGGSGLAGTYTVDESGVINGITITNVGSGYNSVPTVTPQAGGSNAVLTPVLGSSSENTALGYQSLYSNTYGNKNIAIGLGALYSAVSSVNNTAIGYRTLLATTGNSNTALGINSGRNNTTGSNNIYIGPDSAYKSGVTATGSGNVFMGYQTGINNTASNNVFIGYQAGLSNTSGTGLLAIGYQSLISNTTGNYNTANGYYSLYNNTTGIGNVAQGYDSGRTLTTGTYNTFIGYAAGYNASQKVDATNSMALGYGAYTDADNLCQIGNSSLTLIRSAANFECSTAGGGVILKSPDGTRYKITVANDGTVTSTAV